MGELMRFRQSRLPQRRVPAPESILDLRTNADPPASTLKQLQTQATPPPPPANPVGSAGGKNPPAPAIAVPSYFASQTALEQYLANNNQAAAGLLALDDWIAGFNLASSTAQQPGVSALTAKVKALLNNYLPPQSPAQWDALRTLMANLLYGAMMINAAQPSTLLVDIQSRLTRLLLVGGLVDLLLANNSPIKATGDIWNALRWRTLVLPDSVIALVLELRKKKGALLVRKPGFADLYITREEWDHYEAAEIASIENILGGEKKTHVHVLVNQTQTTTTTDDSKTTTQSLDTTTTDQTQLQQQSSSDVSLAVHVDGSVNTSGQYGPVAVTAHVGGSLDYSNNAANSKATTQSHETVARAVNSIVQSTQQIRSVSTLSRDVNRETHEFDNTKNPADPVVGVYRWVDQIQNVELDKYPHRFLMEFEIPEPGAWTRWLHLNDASAGMINKLPLPFLNDLNNPLQASDLTAANYLKFAARYSAAGVSPPPGPQYVSTTLKRDMPATEYNTSKPDWANEPVMVFSDASATVPGGYIAKSWTAGIQSWAWGGGTPMLDISVGSGVHQQVTTAPGGSIQLNAQGSVELSGAGVTTGTVPVGIMTLNIWGFVVNVIIECDPSPETVSAWQNSTFDQILGAYNTLLQAYNNEKAGLDVGVSNLVNTYSPDQNVKIVTQELKRQVIEMLTGVNFTGRGAVSWDSSTVNPAPPKTNLSDAVKYAPEIQFLEQAFEWETLSYFCYPYYWADASRWPDLAMIQGSDQDFADFLRSGSARVVLAARPGFEDQVNLYTYLGILWGGGPAPAAGDADYLSIADEIKEQQQRPLDVSVIDAWQVRLPTTLIWLENATPLPSNSSATIIPEPSIISVIPESAAVGATVTILGACFGATQGGATVKFNGTAAAAIAKWSATSLVLTVPAGATSGDVVVNVSGIDSNPAAFTVL